ncbi:flavodoxin [uncultured Bacteroides sp.]|uniref:flavodoxin n=1 Tax=uncultured Bacteroides sp. TaxID=162156 RepID=UPI002AAAB4CD|nr:flavodoxin [uncultured Bacteroides sp.]
MKVRLIVLVFLTTLTTAVQSQVKHTANGKKILIAYFSHSGNTRTVANQIRSLTCADIFEITPVKPYPMDFNTLVAQVKNEARTRYKPALKTHLNNFQQYNIIILGSPNWWFTIAPPVASFLTSYNFAGKAIVPFITNEGSGLGISESDIKKLCPGATLLKGLPIKGSKVNEAKDNVAKWLKRLQIIK